MTELFKIALKSIGKRKKRTALTMLGVFIGIAAVVALVALGQGLSDTINAQFEKIGADKIIIQAKEQGFGGLDAPGRLTEHEIDIIDNVLGVKEIAGEIFSGALVEFNNVQRTLFMITMPDEKRAAKLAIGFNLWEAMDGRLLTHRDKKKVVVGYNLAYRTTFGKNVRVGDKLKVGGEKFEIVGVLKRVGDPGSDGGIIISEAEARVMLDEPDGFSYIVAQTASGVDPEEVAERIERRLRRDRHQKEGKEDFAVQTSTDLIESFNAVFNIIQFVFVGIAGISLLVGGIGIMNTMFTAVLERTREIGVMKAIGARNRDVLTLFLIESGLLGLAGGIIGVLIGIGIAKLVEFGANTSFGPGTIHASFSPTLIIGALLFSFIVGALSGVLPARRASKLRPVDALRYE